jgi:hypothetical protein
LKGHAKGVLKVIKCLAIFPPCATSGWIKTLSLGLTRQVFYPYATAAKEVLLDLDFLLDVRKEGHVQHRPSQSAACRFASRQKDVYVNVPQILTGNLSSLVIVFFVQLLWSIS